MLTLLRLLRTAALRLSPVWAVTIGKALGLFGYYVVRYRRRIVEAQMSRALGLSPDDAELGRLMRSNFEHYGQLAVEFLRIRRLQAQ